MDTHDTVGQLNGLIETCRDGREGFREASLYVTHPYLKQFFTGASNERSRFVKQLNSAVRFLGGTPVTSGSLTGTLHRTWIEIRGTLIGQDDESILTECERGEDAAVEAYRRVLTALSLPAGIHRLVERQALAIRAMHDKIRQQRDRVA